VAGAFPELPESSFGDDPHAHAPANSMIGKATIILVRKTRTVKSNVRILRIEMSTGC
jgi:hypothetical protein